MIKSDLNCLIPHNPSLSNRNYFFHNSFEVEMKQLHLLVSKSVDKKKTSL